MIESRTSDSTRWLTRLLHNRAAALLVAHLLARRSGVRRLLGRFGRACEDRARRGGASVIAHADARIRADAISQSYAAPTRGKEAVEQRALDVVDHRQTGVSQRAWQQTVTHLDILKHAPRHHTHRYITFPVSEQLGEHAVRLATPRASWAEARLLLFVCRGGAVARVRALSRESESEPLLAVVVERAHVV